MLQSLFSLEKPSPAHNFLKTVAVMDNVKPWVVQKYGGTSIGKLLNTITESIIPEFLQSYNVAVVCSARSSTSKSKGTTTLLLEAIHHVTSSESSPTDLERVIDVIRDEHLAAAKSLFPEHLVADEGNEACTALQTTISDDCKQLRRFLQATWTVGEISERTQDRVLAVGEKLSCRIVVAALNANVSTLDEKKIFSGN
jgi:aspartate kinase